MPKLDDMTARLEEDIIFGRLKPRERLIEDDLMTRFGVKRHVVRQALAELDRLGIVSRPKNKGAMVRDFNVGEVEHIYEMRELLQARAASRLPLPPPPALVERLREIHRRHTAAVEAGDLKAVYHLNNQFHDTLFGACGNPYLTEAIAQYASLAHAIRSYRIANPVLLRQAREEHGRMIEALEGGDRRTLVGLCVDHIKPSKEAYLATVAWEASPEHRESRATSSGRPAE